MIQIAKQNWMPKTLLSSHQYKLQCLLSYSWTKLSDVCQVQPVGSVISLEMAVSIWWDILEHILSLQNGQGEINDGDYVMFVGTILFSRYVDPLVVGRVIGDVVDLFVPTITMSVSYGSKHVNNGCEVKPSMAINPPTLQITGRQTDLYTLVMTDPDAPSPSEPTMREWLHWVLVNMPGGTDTTQGEEVVPYMGPRPPVGIHRYVLVLFKQKSRISTGVGAAPPASRANFNTRAFAVQHDLGLPVAAVHFNAQKEPAKRRR